MNNSPNVVSENLLLATKEEIEWNNGDNNAFYEALKVDGLKKFAEIAGLANGCDMDALIPYWSNAQSILEVGAGYGRVIDYLLKHQFQGKITAIERCNVLFEHLKKKFDKNKNVCLLHDDIRFLNNTNERFDLILILWSGIADFSVKEQSFLIKKLAKLLQKKGILIIDTIPANIVPLGAKKCDKQTYLFQTSDFSAYIYLPNIHEIKHYAKEARLSNVIQTSYKTEANRERCLYIHKLAGFFLM